MVNLSLLNNISVPFFKQGTRKYIFLCLVIFNISNLYPQQNLVQNGSFEEYSACPDQYGQISLATGWSCPNYYAFNPPNEGSLADYYNACTSDIALNVPNNLAGGGEAQSGSAYMGFYALCHADSILCKEYIQGTLTDTLKPNTYYCFKMYWSRADFGYQAINDFSVYFGNEVNDSGSLDLSNLQPQIMNLSGNYLIENNGWTTYEGYFKADGEESHFVIGGFLPANQTPYIQTTGQTDLSYYFVDNVQLYECDSLNPVEEKPAKSITLYPNPAQNVINVAINFPNNKPATLRVFDLAGKAILVKQLTGMINEVDIAHVTNGLYIYDIIQNNTAIKHGKFIIAK